MHIKKNQRALALLALAAMTATVAGVLAQNTQHEAGSGAAPSVEPIQTRELTRPRYVINTGMNFDTRVFSTVATIAAPVTPGDSVNDVVLFLFANAGGVSAAEKGKPNLNVEEVSVGGTKVPWKLDGAVLRVTLPAPATKSFSLTVKYKGSVPIAPPGSAGLGGMLGGMDLSNILGGLGGGDADADETVAPAAAPLPQVSAQSSTKTSRTETMKTVNDEGDELDELLNSLASASTTSNTTTSSSAQTTALAPKTKDENTDYGLYTYDNGILSLGSFWYPSLAVRKNGRWVDAPPQGLGDVAYAETSDYRVKFKVPQGVQVVSTGVEAAAPVAGDNTTTISLSAQNVRDFAVMMSRDYHVQSKAFDVGGKRVLVESYTTKQNAAKSEQAVDIAGRALQIYAKRFGPYPYSRFVVAEAPIRGGAGGMEYSGMTGIAAAIYGDLGKELGDMLGPLGGLMGGSGGGATGMLDSIFETTIAHETAHQWWAIGVGSDSIRQPWVDESLTNYSAMIYYEDRYGKAKAQEMSDTHLKLTYTGGRMIGVADAPVNKPSAAYADNMQYGAIVYGKGALFYAALRQLVGDEVFFMSLREYYAMYDDRLASDTDLKKIVLSSSGAKKAQVEALYQRWIEQTHGDDDINGGKAPSLFDMLGGAGGDFSALLNGGM